jgi:hypothetical protein
VADIFTENIEKKRGENHVKKFRKGGMEPLNVGEREDIELHHQYSLVGQFCIWISE